MAAADRALAAPSGDRQTARMTRLPLVPPVAVWGAAALAQHSLARGSRAGISATVAGIGAAGASAVLGLAAVGAFRRAGTTVDPLHPDRASGLVTDGANGVTRNPMYVALLGALVAHALLRGSPAALLPAAAFWGWIDRVQIPAEERSLEAVFGREFEAYRRRVPRWLGLIGRE